MTISGHMLRDYSNKVKRAVKNGCIDTTREREILYIGCFGYYKAVTAEDDYQRYLEEIHKLYWIVWDKDKKRLIRWRYMVPNTKYIIPQKFIIDSEQNNWEKARLIVDGLTFT